jgi:hypothetical protein
MKDIGRRRRRPKKNSMSEFFLHPRSPLGSSDVDPFAPFPVVLGATERELITISASISLFWMLHRLYREGVEKTTAYLWLAVFHDEIDTQRPMRSAWFTLGFLDKATLYIILANSAAHMDRLRGLKDGQKSLETDKYHLMALQSINKRLGQSEMEVTEGLIGAATGFMCHNVGLNTLIIDSC